MNTSDFIVERAPEVCFTQLSSDEIVILHPSDGQFYHLNASGVLLWLSLEKPRTMSALIHVLEEAYSELPQTYEQDVFAWVKDTAKKGLLVCTAVEALR